jgi:serine/threonine protein kinase/Tol biopolymer transport system component
LTSNTPERVAAGTRIDHYEIVGWLGAGGMGVVYRARDPRLGREVAIKLISEPVATDASRMHRFEQEARAAGQLNHPNIVAVYDIGRFAGSPYIVSELLEGESLRSRLAAGALPPRRAIEFARQIAEGLAAAHERNIVHRDVKPDNLFITRDGRIKILDFGIAKLTAPSGDAAQRTGLPTETEPGLVVGTASYMSPEQVRGEPVDPRSDLFSFGAVFYEMLAGRAPFTRDTAPETMTAILKEDPPPLRAPEVSPSLQRIVSRCLEKTREMRFQSARDLAFGLEVLSDTAAAATAAPASAARSSRWSLRIAAAMVVASLAALAIWLNRAGTLPSIDSQLAQATFTPFTNFDGSETDAAISPDGRFVAFLADRDGTFHVWLKQVGTGQFLNLTPGAGDQRDPGPNRNVGFNADGSEIWDHGGNRMKLRPLAGGAPRVFLSNRAVNVAWAPDGRQLVYFTNDPGDPLFVADGTGGNAHQIYVGEDGDHHHFPTWSHDGRWIYYAGSRQSLTEKDVWRIPSSGGVPERLTDQSTDVQYVTPIDDRTVLYVAPGRDRSGPWLWALDLETRTTHRVSVGLERYLSVAASADGRRLVASVATSSAALWSVPIADRVVEERDVSPYPMPTIRALAPRFARDSLFFLSSSGPGDGLWRLQNGKAVEIWRGADEALQESPAVSPQGDRVVVVRRNGAKLQLTLVSADGADHRSFAEGLDVRGTPAWSPDAKWIVTGGSDAQGPGLFTIPVDGGAPVRLVTGAASDPVWSPDGDVIAYIGRQIASAPILAIHADGRAVNLPDIRIPSGGGGRVRFLPSGKGLVYLQFRRGTESPSGAHDFWQLDLATNQTKQLTRLSSPATVSTFDITPDGTRIVFDRIRENADIRLIDLPK